MGYKRRFGESPKKVDGEQLTEDELRKQLMQEVDVEDLDSQQAFSCFLVEHYTNQEVNLEFSAVKFYTVLEMIQKYEKMKSGK